MRKFITVLIAITVLFSAAAFAEDLSALTDKELLALHQEILVELARRGITDEAEEDSETADIAKRIISFFAAWNSSDPDTMLTMCDSGWKAAAEDPRAELLGILAGRTPMDATVTAISRIAGESPDGLTYCLVHVDSYLDKNDGTEANEYHIRLFVRKEEDGLWRIDPTGLTEEDDSTPERAAAPEVRAEAAADDMVLYYHPGGGAYYHLDQNCKRVNPEFLPLQGCFLYSELNDEPYRVLERCEICGAPFRAETSPLP